MPKETKPSGTKEKKSTKSAKPRKPDKPKVDARVVSLEELMGALMKVSPKEHGKNGDSHERKENA